MGLVLRFGSPITMILAVTGFWWPPACLAALAAGIAHAIAIWRWVKADERQMIEEGERNREAAKRRMLSILERAENSVDTSP